MQWSQIKTLFIVAFLILNAYLVVQLLQQKETADLSLIERQESSIEEQLEADDISLPQLPEEQGEEPYISVKQQTFSKDDIKEVEKIDKQKASLLTNHFLLSELDKPIAIDEESSKEE